MAKHKKQADQSPEVIEPQSEKEPEIEDSLAEDTHGEHHEPLVAKPRPGADGKFARFRRWYVTHKKKSIPATILFILLLTMILPSSRYTVLGLFVKRDYAVIVLDSVSGKPVTEAEVKLSGELVKTNEKGEATISNAHLGPQQLDISKKNYKSLSTEVTVAVSSPKNKSEHKLEATGRQITLAVANKVTGKAVQGASVKVLEAEAKTDEKGEAVVVVPADKTLEKVTIKQAGFNDGTADLDVSDKAPAVAKLTLTPSGKIYFLSKKSGKIDVVKSNLDGTERQVVFAGTGKEQESDTVLLATRDWKYLMLKSRREGEHAKLFLIETGTDKMTVMDEGDANFALTGWQNHDFVFLVSRNKKQPWESKQDAIKSYNADKKQLTVMRESTADVGAAVYIYATERLGNVFLVDDKVLYTTSWNVSCCFADKQAQLVEAKVGSTQDKVLKGVPYQQQYITSGRIYTPNEVYYSFYDITQKNTTRLFEYEDGKLEPTTEVDLDTFYTKSYPRFIQSPSGKAYFWADSRDGKNTLFVGEEDPDTGKEVATLSEYTTYGWFTDDYLLVSKKDSELYIMGKDKDATPLKITDYHKPAFNANYYGGGY